MSRRTETWGQTSGVRMHPRHEQAKSARAALAVAIATIGLLSVFSVVTPAWSQVAIDEQFEKEPTWGIPTAAEIREKVLNWLDDAQLEPEARQKVEGLWPAEQLGGAGLLSQADLLELVVETFAAVDPDAEQLAELTSKPHELAPTPAFEWLDDQQRTPPFARNNLRLWLGKWLAQERRFDEASVYLGGLQPADVVDPAALLFYQGICQHWALQSSAGLRTINLLMEQKKAIPRRYQQLAELMQADLTKLKEESLDHISRRMNDVTRRLDFGHAGKKVRGVEDGIIASLDKLIKDLEDQAGQSSSDSDQGGEDMEEGGSGNPNGIRSRSPANESRIAEGKGAGDVKSKNIGKRSGWGNLPPKEREAAIQQISKEFPSHYRDIIEQYFRKLATEEEEKK